MIFRTISLRSLGIQGLVPPVWSVQFNDCIHAITLRFCVGYVIRFHRLFEAFCKSSSQVFNIRIKWRIAASGLYPEWHEPDFS